MSNFRSAKDVYFDRIRMPGFNDKIPMQDPNSKYARAARLGLCFKCFYEGTDDVDRRPASRGMPFCELCMIDYSIGTEKIERKNKREVKLWFKD